MKKFSSLLIVLLLMLTSFTAGAEDIRGDVNRDGTVDITDVTWLINYLLHSTWYDDPVDNHEWVDLGLPSGTLWATMNIGANNPGECGDYFAWGETAPKEIYNWSTHIWCNGSENTLTKYCTKSNNGNNGFTDDKTELDPEDDAAYVNWGSSWRMPTIEQLQELQQNCTWTWTQQDGNYGQLVTGPNGNTIFLPAAGYRWDHGLYYEEYGNYWSRTLDAGYSTCADNLFFGNSGGFVLYSTRSTGLTVRAVRVSQN